jgi:hypothetical protein
MTPDAYLAGPLIAVLTIAVLTVLLHRIFSSDTSQSTQLMSAPGDDYGLLATAATVRTLADASVVREHLRSAGIRSTLATAPDGQIRVLVFADELMRARRIVG